MKNCETCSNAVFDDHWGELKCKAKQHRIYRPDAVSDCRYYKKGTPSESAKKEEDS